MKTIAEMSKSELISLMKAMVHKDKGLGAYINRMKAELEKKAV